MENTKTKKKWGFHYSKMEKRKFPFVYFIIALPVIQIAIFNLYVNFSTILLAFQDEYGAWSFTAMKRVFDAFVTGVDISGTNPLELVGKSVIIWFVQHGFAFIVSILTSYILTKHMVGSKVFRIIYYLPTIVGGVVFSSVMKEMYAYDGVVVDLLKSCGVKLNIDVMDSGLLGYKGTAFLTLMIQTFVLGCAGGNMIMAGAYMRIPEEIFESAKLEGCGFFRETFQIALPCAWPTFATMTIFALCSILTADCSMYLYSDGTGKFGMTSVGYYLYRFNVNLTLLDSMTSKMKTYTYVSAFGMVITMVTIPIVLLGRKILSKMHEDVEF